MGGSRSGTETPAAVPERTEGQAGERPESTPTSGPARASALRPEIGNRSLASLCGLCVRSHELFRSARQGLVRRHLNGASPVFDLTSATSDRAPADPSLAENLATPRTEWAREKMDRPETLGEAISDDRRTARYRRAGLCDVCSSRLSKGHAYGFTRALGEPCEACAPIIATFPDATASPSWRKHPRGRLRAPSRRTSATLGVVSCTKATGTVLPVGSEVQ